jgi:hypothetical protein
LTVSEAHLYTTASLSLPQSSTSHYQSKIQLRNDITTAAKQKKIKMGANDQAPYR